MTHLKGLPCLFIRMVLVQGLGLNIHGKAGETFRGNVAGFV